MRRLADRDTSWPGKQHVIRAPSPLALGSRSPPRPGRVRDDTARPPGQRSGLSQSAELLTCNAVDAGGPDSAEAPEWRECAAPGVPKPYNGT